MWTARRWRAAPAAGTLPWRPQPAPGSSRRSVHGAPCSRVETLCNERNVEQVSSLPTKATTDLVDRSVQDPFGEANYGSAAELLAQPTGVRSQVRLILRGAPLAALLAALHAKPICQTEWRMETTPALLLQSQCAKTNGAWRLPQLSSVQPTLQRTGIGGSASRSQQHQRQPSDSSVGRPSTSAPVVDSVTQHSRCAVRVCVLPVHPGHLDTNGVRVESSCRPF